MSDMLPERTEHIKLELEGSVLKIWLSQPQNRNALTAGMVQELSETFTALKARQDIRVIVLRGAGGVFCAGGDIKGFQLASQQMAAGDLDAIRVSNRRGGALFQLIDEARQAVIVVVEGFAMGGGFGMACLGDITIAEASAQFAMTEVMLGIVPAQISPFVVRRIGLTAARRFGVSGARLNGSQACAIGIAHEVACGQQELETAIEKLIAQILLCAPNAVATTKALMHRVAQGGLPVHDLLDQAAYDFATALGSDEGREGSGAFVEKRKPSWAVNSDPAKHSQKKLC